MALETQVVGIDFTQGLETRADERLVMPGKLAVLQNGTLSKTGAITRRDGLATLATFPGPTRGHVATFNNELVGIQGPNLYSYDAQAGALTSKGKLSNCTVTKKSVQRSTGLQTMVNCANGGGYTCYVWRDATAGGTINGVNCTVINETTGDQVLPNAVVQAAATANFPHVVATTNAFLIFYTNSAANLFCRVIQFSAPSTLGAEATLRTDGVFTGSSYFDACYFSAASKAAVIYKQVGTANSTVVIGVTQAAGVPSVSGGPTTVTTTAQVTVANTDGMACAATGGVSFCWLFVVGSGGAPGMYAASVDTSFAIVSAAARVDTTAPGTNTICSVTAAIDSANSLITAYWDQVGRFGEDANNLLPIRGVTLNSAAGGITVSVAAAVYLNGHSAAVNKAAAVGGNGINGPFIAGRAFVADRKTYLPVFIGNIKAAELQNTFFLLDASANVMAKALYGTFGLYTSGSGVSTTLATGAAPSVLALSASSFSVPVTERTLLSFANGLNVSQTGVSRLDITVTRSDIGGGIAAVSPITAQLGQSLFIAGGSLSAYDGVAPTEAGFLVFPDDLRLQSFVAGGGLTNGAVYQWVALWEWTDGAGQRHQSAPSPVLTATATNVSANILVPGLLLSQKTNVNLVVFRTLANGSTFYRVNAVNAPATPNGGGSTVTFTDVAADSTISSQEVLYTTGGALPNNGPSGCSVCWVHQNRLWLAGLEDGQEFRFSQTWVQGFGLQWNETLSGRIPNEAGAITAGASIDDKCILFTARKVFAIFGTGPNATGAQNNYSDPTEIVADAGCTEPRSILKIPSGIVFKSNKGWHLLGRDLQVRYIGSAIESYNANTVSGAVLLDDRKEAQFFSVDGTTLVYSYLVDQWSTFSGAGGDQFSGATWWAAQNQLVAYDLSVPAIRKSTPNTYTGSTIITIQTAWLKPGAALHGFQRVYSLLLAGAFSSLSSLVIYVGYDYDSAFNTLVIVNDTTTLQTPSGNAWLLRYGLPIQKCSAVRFKIVESPGQAPWTGTTIASMSLEVGVKRGAAKLKPAQSL